MRLKSFDRFSYLRFRAADLFWLASIALLSGCMSMGKPDAAAMKQLDFGPPETLRICVFLDNDDIPQSKGEALIEAVNTEPGYAP